MSSLDYLDLCRLCLVKDRVSVPIFEGEGDVRQIFLKIAACLPVKVTREDKLPKKICDDCVYKVELFYQFWNTTANAEKQLLQWLGEVNIEDKQGYVTNVLNPNVMKQEQRPENRLDGNVMQQVGEHQNNMGMGMMDNMGLGIPMMISNANQQQQITSVPMDTSGNSVQPVQAVPGPSSQTTHNQISQNQSSSTQQEDEEESSEDEENSDDECDGDEGLPVKEESEEDPNNRTIEPTTFVNVSLACDEAGPSGLQQKISDIPEMPMPQTADGDPKTGSAIRQLIFENKMPKKIKRNHEDVEHDLKRNDTVQNNYPWHDKINCDPLKIESNNCISMIKIEDDSTNLTNTVILPIESIFLPCYVENENDHLWNRIEMNNERNKISEVQRNEISKVQRNEILCTEKCSEQKKEVEKVPEGDSQKEEVDQILETLRNVCPVCQRQFDDENLMQRHYKRIHKGPYTCYKCQKGYYSKVALREHEKASHKVDFTFLECVNCLQKFKHKLGLRRHQLRFHSNLEAKFVCDYCDKRYKLKNDLSDHIKRTHTKLPSVCKYCGKSVKNIVGHEWKHLKTEKKVSYHHFCHLCLKKFTNNNQLVNHLVQHKVGFKCNVCEESFDLPSALHKHKFVKHKPSFVCSICKGAFTARSSFYTHVLTHDGIRPYKCDVCGEDFTQGSSLRRHRKHHPGPLPPLTTTTKIAEIAKKILDKA
ncbi:zinc finger protein 675-like isoform X7 [Osmia bicornis bicornis]|uniref:zinc finger protein 675-like isoform X7 n=1 Tax=Osmia bicornis bicornis TaxID=1437191 RepID=UPI001EAF76BC|nr:zinc finger protein 675-like isoform X7 [Osmia bicornis bicornis]